MGHLSIVPGKELRERFASANLTVQELSSLMQEYVGWASSDDSALKNKGWPSTPITSYPAGVVKIVRQMVGDCGSDSQHFNAPFRDYES